MPARSPWTLGGPISAAAPLRFPEGAALLTLTERGALIALSDALQWRSEARQLPDNESLLEGWSAADGGESADMGGQAEDGGAGGADARALGEGGWVSDRFGAYLALPPLPPEAPPATEALGLLPLEAPAVPLTLIFTRGLWSLRGGRWLPSEEGARYQPFSALAEGPEETLWLRCAGGLLRWTSGRWSLQPLSAQLPSQLTIAPWEERGTHALWLSERAGGEISALFQSQRWSHESWVGRSLVGSLDGIYALSDGALAEEPTEGSALLVGRDSDPWARSGLPEGAPRPRQLVGRWSHSGLWLEGEDGSWWRGDDHVLSPIEGLAEERSQGTLRAWGDDEGRLILAWPGGAQLVRPGRVVSAEGLEGPFRGAEGGIVRLLPDEPEEVTELSVTLGEAPPELLEGPPWSFQVRASEMNRGGERALRVTVQYRDGEELSRSWVVFLEEPISWERDIEPIFVEECARCHDNRAGATRVLETPEQWEADFDEILRQIRAGAMPIGAPPLSAAELELVERWRADGFLPQWP